MRVNVSQHSPVSDPLRATAWPAAVPFFARGEHIPLLTAVAALRRTETVYPPQECLLRAFQLTDFSAVKVLILGQDPYHGAGQAHGLAFSVPRGVPVPRSLVNIRKEILQDVYAGVTPPHWKPEPAGLLKLCAEDARRQGASLGGGSTPAGKKQCAGETGRHPDCEGRNSIGGDGQGGIPSAAGADAAALRWPPDSGNLEHWARQGVLLLNVACSVRAGAAGSHAKLGWQAMTQAVLKALAARPKPVAVLLWGGWAAAYAELFAGGGHLVLTAAHPSPLSASRGFFGCRHFSQVNAWLKAQGRGEICW